MSVSTRDAVLQYEQRKRREKDEEEEEAAERTAKTVYDLQRIKLERLTANIDEEEEEAAERTAKTVYDLQRIKLERLTANIDKPVPIPVLKKKWEPFKPPEFVRNVVGSSAGAGSGEYHIYRNSRRREQARLQYINDNAKQEEMDDEFKEKRKRNIEENDARTAKKRAKRMKKKKNRGKKKVKIGTEKSSDEDSESEDEETQKKEEEHVTQYTIVPNA